MVVAHINGKMLAWARHRAGVDIAALAKGSVTLAKLTAWENGDEKPSQNQAIALADKLGISYAMLFMPDVPPPDNPNIPDLRTVSGRQLKDPSLDFRDVLNDTLVRQEWMRDERIEQDWTPLPFVGKFAIDNNPLSVAGDMRKSLQLSAADRARYHDFEAFLRHLVARAEAIGILVMRSAVVRHDTHRKLNVSEFRGFAVSDAFAPTIFINDSDAKAAQVFTVAHELAHLWIGADGVSDRRPNQRDDSLNSTEVFCDRVAAELLVPEAEFNFVWRPGSVLGSARAAAAHFRVSTLVALRRAKDLGKIQYEPFIEAVDAEYARFREIDRS